MLNDFFRFSESPLWDIQKDYYKQLGMETWRKNMVPFIATTNSFVANSYAQTISGYISDIEKNNPKAIPINIIELGAGHGRFSFMILKALNEIYKDHEIAPFKYIITDIANASIQAWEKHEKLNKFIINGTLDFALFDVVEQEDTKLIISNSSLEKTIKNKPLVIIANFISDVLPFDLFKIQNGKILECSVAIEANEVSDDDKPESIIKSTRLLQQYTPFTGKYYNDAKLDDLLDYYVDNITDSIIQIPFYTLKTIDYFNNLSKENLWLIAEEAEINLEELDGNKTTGIKKEGSFTARVNMHAIRRYIRSKNSVFLSSDLPDRRFDCYAILNNTDQYSYSITKNMFLQFNILFGPRSFFRFFVSVSRTNVQLSDDGILSFLELSKYDPYIIRRFQNEILNVCLETKGFKREALKIALLKTWDNYYDIGEDYELAYYLGRMFRRLKAYKEAIDLFHIALKHNKSNKYKIYYWMGRVSLDIKKIKNATEYFKIAFKINPNSKDVNDELNKLGIIIEDLNLDKIYLHEYIELKVNSSVSGFGLANIKKIYKNEIVWQASENHPIYSLSNIKNWSKSRKNEFIKYAYECEKDYYLLDDTIGRYMNHSCSPNCVWKDNRTLIAVKDIELGSEITYDYATSELTRNLKLNCKCKSENCRKIVTNKDYLLKEFQVRYKNHLTTHIALAIKDLK